MRWLCAVLPFAMGGCQPVGARETNIPTMKVEYAQGDSAAVIARWTRACDAKGCADRYAVSWRVGGVTGVMREITRLADTAMVARPAFGDSLVVTIAVTPIRRGLSGAVRMASAVVRNPDTPPPPVDSLRADTLDVLAAELDSFPVISVRDTLGHSSGTFAPGEGTVLCGLSRNRYTGEIRLFIPADAPEGADEYLAMVCERARQSFQWERGG